MFIVINITIPGSCWIVMHSSSSVCIYLRINVIDSPPSQIVILFVVCVLRFQNSIEILNTVLTLSSTISYALKICSIYCPPL